MLVATKRFLFGDCQMFGKIYVMINARKGRKKKVDEQRIIQINYYYFIC
jgi:hypothetical protein